MNFNNNYIEKQGKIRSSANKLIKISLQYIYYDKNTLTFALY